MNDIKNHIKATDEVLQKASKLINTNEYIKLREKYHDPEHFSIQGLWKVRILSSKAMNLAKKVIANGGTENEVKIALQYLYICIDAEKYQLNWKKFEDDYDVDLLWQKYIGKGSL